jgi:adenine C2-methylase RlmN of 23S rRNA A2503 and tRNA A37
VSSRTPLIRNLTSSEMLQLIEACFTALPPDARPVELSFTGEGEPALNWRACAAACAAARERWPTLTGVRYCFSGLGAPVLLAKLAGGGLPMRLQFSLHAARQDVRDRLIPRSAPLTDILAALQATRARFTAIELNVALQAGQNDSDTDLDALAGWGDPAWPVLLNPLLTEQGAVASPRAGHFAQQLACSGRIVRHYRQVGARISERRVYPLMTARRV